jgi:hypothetical protein
MSEEGTLELRHSGGDTWTVTGGSAARRLTENGSGTFQSFGPFECDGSYVQTTETTVDGSGSTSSPTGTVTLRAGTSGPYTFSLAGPAIAVVGTELLSHTFVTMNGADCPARTETRELNAFPITAGSFAGGPLSGSGTVDPAQPGVLRGSRSGPLPADPRQDFQLTWEIVFQ